MKLLFIVSFLLFGFASFSQKATFKNDTLVYKERKFTVGDTVNVSYGSGTDGKFIFVLIGSGMGGTSALESSYSKTQIVIDKIYKSSGRYLIRGKVQGVTTLGMNKIFIEPEGAIDKKEID